MNKERNKGNSFIMVIATLSFLTILVVAILVAIAYIYRLRSYNINSRDNFYYLEQAMDEIYAGVGTDAMGHLNKAYDETVEVIVYFDPVSKAYITMKNDEANDLLQTHYIKLLLDDPNYATYTTVEDHFKQFMTYGYDKDKNPEGVQIAINSNLVKNKNGIIVKDLVLRREAKYSTYNTVKSKDKLKPETFVQTISTDIVISKPKFYVDFNTIGSDLSTLYKFAMIADCGVEIIGTATDVTINGNIYAASDFYNKDYNKGTVTVTNPDGTKSTVNASLNAYKQSRLDTFDGVNEKSMYSGFYVDGSDVTITAGTVIVPGTLAIMNGAKVNMAGLSQSIVSATDLWADNITLGGYSFKDPNNEDKAIGAQASFRAIAYISDDLELNAAGSNFLLNGQYYGYNYSSINNRTYEEAALKKAQNRTFVTAVPEGITNHVPTTDGDKVKGEQAHYNSSAIIVNGKDSTLDLSKTSAMYVAGQSYIELTKTKTAVPKKGVTNKTKNDDDTYGTEDVEAYTFSYDVNKDDFTQSGKDKGDLQDYRTGEAISIKSNQLAYIPNWAIQTNEETGEMYVSIPETLREQDMFKKIWAQLDKVPVVKNVISGKAYYYFDFSALHTKQGDDSLAINDFIAEYSKLVNTMEPDEKGNDTDISHGARLTLTDIGDYTYFKVNTVRLHADRAGKEENNNEYSVFTNSAISVKEPAIAIDKDQRVTIKAKSSNMKALVAAAENINAAENEKLGNELTAENSNGIDTNGLAGVTNAGVQVKTATDISNKLQLHYLEMKLLLTNKSHDSAAVAEAHNTAESKISPINHYFNFALLNSSEYNTLKVLEIAPGYNVWLCGGQDEVEIKPLTDKDTELKGIILCKGDVKFDSRITDFQGLIVTGGKIIVNKSMNFTANEEIIKTILRMCDESQANPKGSADNFEIVINLFKQYQSFYKPEVPGAEIDTESTKSITAVQFEDILTYQNWKKNVD